MKTITQYREDIKSLMAKAAEMDTHAQADNRELTEAEITLKDKLLGKVEDLYTMVAVLERQERVQAQLAAPEPVQSRPKNKPTEDLQVGDDRRSKDRFASFGQQLAAVMRASIPGGSVDARLFNAATGLGESIPSDGGFLVQTDFATDILQQVWETGVLVSRCREITLSGASNSLKVNGVDEDSRATGSRGGGVRGYWVNEADQKTESKPKFRQIELNLKKLIGLCYATDELLDDAAALESYIRAGFVSEFGFLMDDAIINGTGAGQPLGILNSGSLVSVAKEAGQDADTIVAENIVKMYSRLFAASRVNSIWLINQQIEPQLHLMGVSVGLGGQLVYMPPGGLSQAAYGSLLGRPVIPIEQCQALGDQGDIILADFTNGYLLARKGGIESAMSIHVKFIYDESVFRFVLRVDGQPVRSKVLTPYKGGSGATQSHFITLDERA